ncbi:MAG TPA: protein-L-isoaspartate(D-aspartate) O-methyltransferase [Sphingomicrobium sp.]|nr:protein-L-isoaspartate(D-aspartate) O-methyltransferase [Sphingomicrobium sp.]
MVELIDMYFDLAEEEIGRDALTPVLRRALLDVPRHLFVPPQLVAMAYQDTPLPIGFDKTVSKPFMGAVMIELLNLAPGARVLEVGTGLGYQAAVMAEIGAEVRSVEIVEEFAEAAKARLQALGHHADVRVGDGSRGWPKHQPFDAILVTAASPEPPQPLVEQLKPGGRMVLPLGDKNGQQLTLMEKAEDGTIVSTAIMPVVFTQLESATSKMP